MRKLGVTCAAIAMAVSSFALMPAAGAAEADLAFPCEYGSEEGPSYDLGPACDQAYYEAWDTIWLVRDLAYNTIDYANEQFARVCRELPPELIQCQAPG